MQRFWFAVLMCTALASVPHAQDALTAGQRTADLNQLASFYAKNYAPYEWKRDVLGFDLYDVNPWLRAIHKADDLDFQEVLIDYVASLNDAHDYIAFPTLFSASLGLSVDIYDGKVLIDAINRTTLPASQYPFVVGDEVVSVDKQPVEVLIRSFRKYAIAANQRSTDRTAASRIVSRNQQIMPHIPELGNSASVVIRQASTGATTTFTIPWSKIGIPLTSQGRGRGGICRGRSTFHKNSTHHRHWTSSRRRYRASRSLRRPTSTRWRKLSLPTTPSLPTCVRLLRCSTSA